MARDAIAELRAVRARRQAAASHPVASADWLELQPLPASTQTFVVPRFDPGLLPHRLRAWVVDVAARASLPLEMVAIPTMVAYGALIARRVGIRPSRQDDWTVVSNLWGAIVGRPGLLKSHAISAALAPVSRLEAQARQEWEASAAEIAAQRDTITARIAGIKGAIAQAEKKGNDTSLMETSLTSLLADLADIPTGPRRYMVADATQEKIADLLVSNTHGLTLVRDELVGWLAGMEQDNHKADRPFYLTAWNGDQGYAVDRIGRGSVWVPCLCLSVIGSIQPAKLDAYIDEAVRGGGSDGLLARIQLLVWPDEVPAYHTPGRPDHDARESAQRLADSLAGLDPTTLGAAQDDALPYLRFAPDAQAMWDAWRSRLEARLRGTEFADAPAYDSHISKYRSLVPSLALILHICDGGTGDVSLDALQRATAWATYLEAHARKMYRRELDHGDGAAQALLDRIRSGDVTDGMTVRDIYRRHWGGLDDRLSVTRAVEVLQPLGWVRVERRLTGAGRPVDVIAVNPAALKTTS
jgi:putative DNA primase/helicase